MVCAKAQGGRKPVSEEGQSDWTVISRREGKACGPSGPELCFYSGCHDPADALISADWTGPCLSGSLYRL